MEFKHRQELKFKIDLAMRLQRLCGVDNPIDYRTEIHSERMKEDPLVHCSLNSLPSSPDGRIGFYHETVVPPRFSDFLTHPKKSMAKLREALDHAEDVYSGSPVSVVALVFATQASASTTFVCVPKDFFVTGDGEDRNSQVSYMRVAKVGAENGALIFTLRNFLLAAEISRVEEEE